ncbi:5-deoxy-glucuronate isomerase [Cellulomonas cellasea]|uniref:5-deoxy-glucuronate isomerase n=1 Tax=Cellulomonas cellasea TaxID=43670 RepID=A0A7W4UD00_9CELL|nr:5-deoxy-glucuronate isomerase [Cellulomonas cellasea]MBB2921258.1 5-deoxy-glucuronate isomerase [Cellulomonas cellasea]
MSTTTNPTTRDLLLRAGSTTDAAADVAAITPERAGWSWSGLHVLRLGPGESRSLNLDRDEAVVLPLAGGCSVTVTGLDGEEQTVALVGRHDVFSGPSDFVYAPLGSTLVVTAPGDRAVRIGIATSRAGRHLPVRHGKADEARVDLRGAGRASRRVTNYTLGTDVEVDHLLVCEVLTPGGNWSSYPPHKHDAHSETERELEEIYYFEVADGPDGPGLAYHRVYGTEDRPIDVLAEVRTGDVVLVPHGYHGPSMAAPGYDLYYLNVMAGPADDRRWLSVDDPAHAWVRSTWDTDQIDPRLEGEHA